MSGVDFDALRDGLEEQLAAELSDLLEGGADDLAVLAGSMSQNLTEALAEGRSDLAREIADQVRALAEAQRLAAVDAQWGAVTAVVRTLTGAVIVALRASGGLPTLSGGAA